MTDTLDAIAREMEAECPGYAGPDAEYSVDASKVWAWAQALRKITALSNQGEGSATGRVNGYLLSQRAVEVICDGDIPEWMTAKPGLRVYLSQNPAEADRRDAERYRWLRDAENEGPNLVAKYAGKDLDDVIDQYAATQEQT